MLGLSMASHTEMSFAIVFKLGMKFSESNLVRQSQGIACSKTSNKSVYDNLSLSDPPGNHGNELLMWINADANGRIFISLGFFTLLCGQAD